MKPYFIAVFIFVVLFACKKEEVAPFPEHFTVSGFVVDENNRPVAGALVSATGGKADTTDDQGTWVLENLLPGEFISASLANHGTSPSSIQASRVISPFTFTVNYQPDSTEIQITGWMKQQQIPNGLVPSTEGGPVVSLYDQALAAMVFMLYGELDRARLIFDFFDERITSELQKGVGGFSQFRNPAGQPNGHRWMGDNAWLLIALNNYAALTGSTQYTELQTALSQWLLSLQDADGGFWAGYDAAGARLNYKVTEGNIDAYNALLGYANEHAQVLNFLENERWDATTQSLMAWPENPAYRFALDCHSWSYAIFNDYPEGTLTAADRFITTQTATLTGAQVTGYDIDEDLDHVFVEGTGHMALAFKLAGNEARANELLNQTQLMWYTSLNRPESGGFPYASNFGTGYGSDPHWQGVDTQIALSAGAWYLFAKRVFNPFEVGKKKHVPIEDQFWR